MHLLDYFRMDVKWAMGWMTKISSIAIPKGTVLTQETTNTEGCPKDGGVIEDK